jgi:hypothetical protein
VVNGLLAEGLPGEKNAKVVYIHKPGKTDWTSPKSYSHLPPQHDREDGGESRGRLPVPDGGAERLVAPGAMRVTDGKINDRRFCILQAPSC